MKKIFFGLLLLIAAVIADSYIEEAMMKRKRFEMPRWMTLAVFIIGLTIILTGCAHASRQFVAQADGTVVEIEGYDEWPEATLGLMLCSMDNKPVIFYRSGLPQTADVEFTRVHEMVHHRQMRADCKGFMARYQTDSLFRIEKEREAYCADMWAQVKAGRDKVTVANSMAEIMRRKYGVTSVHCPQPP